MPKLRYHAKRLGPEKLEVIRLANDILNEYADQGFTLTLRQLYYQFVARGYIPNRDREYNRLGTIIADGRMGGLIDWDAIVDRTRNLAAGAHWSSPASIIRSAASGYAIDKWERQENYVEVWIEKDALVGVIERPCRRLDVPYFSCRGYTSLSEMWAASQRIYRKARAGKQVTIIHLGDHDPSGIDMSRDIEERILKFVALDYLRNDYDDDERDATAAAAVLDWAADHFRLNRVALNMDQILLYNPPPNPAKLTDSRGAGYVSLHGGQSWELDALEPTVIADLIDQAVSELRDEDAWDEDLAAEAEQRSTLEAASDRWTDVVAFLNGGTK